MNVSTGERWASALAGGGLAALGLSRRSLAGLVLAGLGGGLLYRGLTGHCGLYQQLGINTAIRHPSPRTGVRAQHGVRIEKSITVNRPASELFAFWRDLGNLPLVMDHVLMVESRDERRSHWVARAPFDTTLEWDSEIINERPDELLAWRSTGGDVDTAGSVHFRSAPGDRGTTVTVNLKYDPPGGKASAVLAHFLGQGLEDQLDEDLRHFKQIMEAGEVPTSRNRVLEELDR